MKPTVWKQLAPFLNRPRLDIAQLAFVAVIGGIAEAAVLVLIVRSALSLTGDAAEQLSLPVVSHDLSTGAMIGAAGLLGLAGLVAHLFIAWLSAKMSAEVLANARHRAVECFTNASWAHQSLEREGTLQHAVSNLSLACANLSQVVTNVVAALINLAAFMVIALIVDPLGTGVVVGFGLILFGALRPVSSLTKRRARKFVQTNNALADDVSHFSTLAMELRSFGVSRVAADQIHARIDDTAGRQRGARFVARFGATLYRDLAILFLVGAVAAMYAAGGGAVLGISTVVVLIVRALSSAQMVQSGIQSINEQLPNVETLHQRLESLSASAFVTGNIQTDGLSVIEFCDVAYRYSEGDLPALSGVNLRIEPGEVLGIVGPSGGGKSTFVQLLLRLRVPTAGRVMVDDGDYLEIDPAVWSSLTALVPQEPRMMEATIAENISFFRRGFTNEAIRQAAEAAHVADEIDRLSASFETLLGPRGAGLSGGQKQRVAIARALVGKPRLLVLDEPTSALDVNSERKFKETIEELKGATTMVIVAHRLTTLEFCDRILVLQEGRVTAVGSPGELRSTPGFFQWAEGIHNSPQGQSDGLTGAASRPAE